MSDMKEKLNEWRLGYWTIQSYENNLANAPEKITEAQTEKYNKLAEIKNDPATWNYIVNNGHLTLEGNDKDSLKKFFNQLDESEGLNPGVLDEYGRGLFADKSDFHYAGDNVPAKISGFTITKLESYGGEGEGDSFWAVFSVEKDGVQKYWKWDGWYASYDGGYLESLFEVEPEQVVVTKWKEKK
jgi:hypothetical protein